MFYYSILLLISLAPRYSVPLNHIIFSENIYLDYFLSYLLNPLTFSVDIRYCLDYLAFY
jgi:hypothetical protein